MHAPLIRFAATIAREAAPVVVVGLDDAPVLNPRVRSPLVAVPEVNARRLVGLLRRGETPGDGVLAESLGMDEEALGGAVPILIPGPDAGWTTTDAALLASALAGRTAAVLMTGRPSGFAQRAVDLADVLRAASASPLLVGRLPSDDALAPCCPVAILQALPDADEADVTAILRVRDDAKVLDHTLGWLASEGIQTTVVDGGSTDGSVRIAEGWMGRGVDAVLRGGSEAEASFLSESLGSGRTRGWLLRLGANERVESPLPNMGLRKTLGRMEAAGWDVVAATTVEVGPGPGDDGRSDFGRGPRPWRFALPNPSAEPVARVAGSPSTRRSPYNLLVRSYPVGRAADRARPAPDSSAPPAAWEAWDETARGDYLIERLSGHGIFRRLYPAPPECVWFTEQRIGGWAMSLLNADIRNLPDPDPLAPAPAVVRIGWEIPDGPPASLSVASGTGAASVVGRGVAGTVSIDSVEPNEDYEARLIADDSPDRVLGEVRFGIRLELGA